MTNEIVDTFNREFGRIDKISFLDNQGTEINSQYVRGEYLSELQKFINRCSLNPTASVKFIYSPVALPEMEIYIDHLGYPSFTPDTAANILKLNLQQKTVYKIINGKAVPK